MSTELAEYGSPSREIATYETAGSAAASQAKALVEARYIMAMRFPRNEEEVRQKLLKECLRPSFAAVAIYHKPIGDGIEGPSIRFAEAALRMMKNITIDTMTVYDDREKRIVRVTVTDLEANLPYAQDVTIEKTVERRKSKPGDDVLRVRKNKRGDDVFVLVATDDEILNKQNALISKAIRTQGLRLVPGDLIDEALYVVRETRRNKDAKDPDAARRQIFDAFDEQGVSASQLSDYLGHDGSKLTEKERSDLRGLYAALRDGETSWREIMDAKQPASQAPTGEAKAGSLKEGLNKTRPKKDEAPHVTADDVAAALKKADTLDALDEAWDMKNLVKDITKNEEQQLSVLYTKRSKTIS